MAPEGFGTRIAKRRHVLDLRQWQLAELVGVSKTTVAKWESGQHFPLKHLGKLEQVLGINLSEPESAIDSHEAEYRARLASLQADEFMTAAEAADALERYQERRRRARGNTTVAERAS